MSTMMGRVHASNANRRRWRARARLPAAAPLGYLALDPNSRVFEGRSLEEAESKRDRYERWGLGSR